MSFSAAIFDMDGTVLDTLADLAASLNYAFSLLGHTRPFSMDEVRLFVGSGIKTAVVRALLLEQGTAPENLEFIDASDAETLPDSMQKEAHSIHAVFKEHYEAHCYDRTAPYEGMEELLKCLRREGVRCAVVSNKPDAAVQILAGRLLPSFFDLCIGEQEGIPKKPAPDMLLYALERMGIADKKKAVYIGDSEIDLQTAANAGLTCIGVDWGFRGHEFLVRHGCTLTVQSPLEIASIILRDPQDPE